MRTVIHYMLERGTLAPGDQALLAKHFQLTRQRVNQLVSLERSSMKPSETDAGDAAAALEGPAGRNCLKETEEMSYQQHVRAQCLDCATPMFVIDDVRAIPTRCERCHRKYDQQMILLREFLRRPSGPPAQ